MIFFTVVGIYVTDDIEIKLITLITLLKNDHSFISLSLDKSFIIFYSGYKFSYDLTSLILRSGRFMTIQKKEEFCRICFLFHTSFMLNMIFYIFIYSTFLHSLIRCTICF